MSERTLISVMDWFQEAVRSKQPIPPSMWVDAGMQMNVLRAEYDDKLIDMECDLAKKKATLMEGDMTSAKAETLIRATDEYREIKKLSALLNRVEELIRLSKKRAQMASDELRN